MVKERALNRIWNWNWICDVWTRTHRVTFPANYIGHGYYAPPLIGGIKRCFCLTSVWRLSVAYIGPKSRTERPRKTKIGTEVAHVTRDWNTTFKVKRSKVKVTRPLCLPPCWRVRRLQRWAWERAGRGKLLVRCRLLGGARRFGAHSGRRGAGAYRGGRPPTACFTCCSQNREAAAIPTAAIPTTAIQTFSKWVMQWVRVRIKVRAIG